MYMSTVTETEVSASTKGKSEGAVTYKYTSTVAVAFARSAVLDVVSLYANGDQFYSTIGFDPGLQTHDVHHIDTYAFPGDGGTYHILLFYFLRSSNDWPDVSSGAEFTITGPVPQNTGANMIVSTFPLVPSGLDHTTYVIIGFNKGNSKNGVTAGVPVAYPAGTWNLANASSSASSTW